MDYKLIKYNEQYAKNWDDFIFNESVNGTFLQTRNFLNYHGNCFTDNSYLLYNEKDQLSAVVPACLVIEDGKRKLYSHKGSTFGGIVFNQECYEINKLRSIVALIEKQAISEEIDEIILKITPDIYSFINNDLFEYVLSNNGYQENKELVAIIDYSKYSEDTRMNYSKMKRRNVAHCETAGCQFVNLEKQNEIEIFYDVLCKNLEKYETRPVHTVQELLDLKNIYLKNECEFFGIELEGKIIAGTMLFYFNRVNVAHTQYLCALPEYNNLSPMSFLYDNIIHMIKKKKYRILSWGGNRGLGKVFKYWLSGEQRSIWRRVLD